MQRLQKPQRTHLTPAEYHIIETAIRTNDVVPVMEFLENYSPEIINKPLSSTSNWTPLMLAAYYRSVDVLRLFVNSDKVNVNYVHQGNTALTRAFRWDVFDPRLPTILQLLLDKSDMVDIDQNRTIIFTAFNANIPEQMVALARTPQFRDYNLLEQRNEAGATVLKFAFQSLDYGDDYNVGGDKFNLIAALLKTPGIEKIHDSINYAYADSNSLLMNAIEDCEVDKISLLLAMPGIDVNAGCLHKGGILHFVLEMGLRAEQDHHLYQRNKLSIDDVEKILLLLFCHAGTKSSLLNEEGKTLFSFLMSNYPLDDIQRLLPLFLTRNDFDMYSVGVDGMSALLSSEVVSDIHKIYYLLSLGFDINSQDASNRDLLFYAVRLNRLDIVATLLLIQTLDINQVSDSYTALHAAIEAGNIEMVKMLIADPRININFELPHRGTPLVYALACQQGEIAQVILLHPNINVLQTIQKSDANALIVAAALPSADMLKLIVPYFMKANLLNKRDNKGNTALHVATMFNQLECAQLLVGAGSNIDVENNDKLTASQIAKNNHNDEIDLLLIESSIHFFRSRLDAIQFYDRVIPHTVIIDYLDPFTQQLMEDPVTVNTGATFDRRSLLMQFIAAGCPDSIICVITGGTIFKSELNSGTNIFIKKAIEKFVAEQERAFYLKYHSDSPALCSASLFSQPASAATSLTSSQDIYSSERDVKLPPPKLQKNAHELGSNKPTEADLLALYAGKTFSLTK